MKAYIFAGGRVDASAIVTSPADDDLCIAADSGFDNAQQLGYADRIDKLVGDFDSVREKDFPAHAEIIRVPAEKDLTDTQLAVAVAIDEGAQEIIIVGGLSGRLDHTLSNLYLLEFLAERGIYATVVDGQNRARYINRSSLLIARSEYKYFSLICVEKEAKGVSVDGAKYPLKKATLTRELQYAVSNEVEGNCALVSVKKGSLFIIESKDSQI